MKKTYFISDFHLGVDTNVPSKVRERYVVHWLDCIKEDAAAIYFLGDILDYWFEYKSVVPKGFTRLFGKISELTDRGISIEWFIGNHDMWTFGYFENELGVKIKKTPELKVINNKACYLCHGDGLGHGDLGYKIIKAIISNPLCQSLFTLIPSSLGIWMMKSSSKGSRYSQNVHSKKEKLKDERLHQYFEEFSNDEKVDYFIYGHLHHGEIRTLSNGSSKSINLGDWTSLWTYAEMNEKGEIELKKHPIPS
ncbi:MAG: UDP-2,3-diacylglucosamine diphosphatase [Saprospiraceae bacterium]|nr:UDP-2,3-diacylglucosamine diphosphatase [Saprospiraceae bacterium]